MNQGGTKDKGYITDRFFEREMLMRRGVEITDEMVRRAEIEAAKREPHISHHFDVEHMSDDQRNEIGFLGEFACCELFGINWEGNIRDNYLTIDNGDIRLGEYLIDVKTETIPQPYFDKVFNRRIDDDKPYGRRLITKKQVPLLEKYDLVVFGAFVRGCYKKWYALGYVYVEDVLQRYQVTDMAPFGTKYPEPAIAVRNSELHQMDELS